MTPALDIINTFLAGQSGIVLMVFTRCAAAMAVLPAIGEHVIPVRIKLAIAFAVTLAVLPMVSTQQPIPPGVAHLFLTVASESVTGLLIGFLLRLFVYALQIGGAIAAQSTALSQIFATAGSDPLPAISHLLTWAGFALFMLAGMHIRMVEYLALSFNLFPAGLFPMAALSSEWTVQRVSAMFSLGFQLAAPFVLLSVLYNIMLGVINRAMPQLMVAFVGAPLITMGSLVLLFLSAPLLLPVWLQGLDTFLDNPSGGR